MWDFSRNDEKPHETEKSDRGSAESPSGFLHAIN